MGLLAQIVAGFVALALTLVAAYVVFLSSSRANLEAEVQREGQQIAEYLRRTDIFEPQPPYIDIYLLQAYQKKHPDLSKRKLLYRIAYDLTSATVFHSVDFSEFFEIAQRGNIPGKLSGRIALWVVQQSLASLVPRETEWPRTVANFPEIPQSFSLLHRASFPFGPLGLNTWLDEFKLVRETIALITFPIHRRFFLEDLRLFFDEAEKDALPWQRFDYKQWIENVEKSTEEITIHTSHISSLLGLRDTFSTAIRLPNLRWFIMLTMLLFCLGIVIPLIIVGLRLESDVPLAVNMTILSITIAVSFGVAWILGSDLARDPEQKLMQVRYLIPLRDQILTDRQKRNAEVTFDFDLVNFILDERNMLKLNQKECQLLEEYRTAVLTSNSASEETARVLADKLRSNAILAKYKPEPEAGGRSLSILRPLDESSWREFANDIRSGLEVIIQDNRGHVTSDILKLRFPDDEKEEEQVRLELEHLYQEYKSQREYKEFEDSRKNLEKRQEEVLSWLPRKIESAR